MLSTTELIARARTVLRPRRLSGDNSAGDVACALEADSGAIYLGVCIDVSSGIGFCAEHAAIAAMVTAGETRIRQIVAVWGDDVVLPPCGRCREFMYQVDRDNFAGTQVILGQERREPLSALLPHPYDEVWGPPTSTPDGVGA
ncbi:MAG TPA: cytidine deaminase [Anaerolineales bacterium]|nr:cytidine deaminase [Anaerolineales bacterium]